MVTVSAHVPSHWKVSIEHVGNEQLPVLIIDNVLKYAEAVVDHAAQQRFAALAPHYPGLRAPAPHDYLAQIMPGILPLLRDVFSYRHGADVKECFYSLLTTPPEALRPIQRLPHFDGVGDDKVAILHYLSPHESGGTYFYRHRSSGFESVPNARFQNYRSLISREADKFGIPKASYPDGDTDMFERFYKIDATFNRLVLYRGISIHAVGVPEGFDFSDDPRTGRLTVNTFVSPAKSL
ncbi:MAG: DUF6445 family protein [Pseudomonadota bacterium]